MENALKHILRHSIRFYRCFVDLTGDVVSALILSQLIYWSEKYNYGEFYVSDTQLQEQLGVPIRTLKRHRKKLIEKELITYDLRGIPRRGIYAVNYQTIAERLENLELSKSGVSNENNHEIINEWDAILDLEKEIEQNEPLARQQGTNWNNNKGQIGTTRGDKLEQQAGSNWHHNRGQIGTIRGDKLELQEGTNWHDNKIINKITKEKTKEITKEITKEKDKRDTNLTVSVVETDQRVFEIVNLWNDFASKYYLPKVAKVSEKRKKHILKRLEEKEFDFKLILEKIKQSDFLRGLKTNWRVDFDFIIDSPNNYIKILEGKYDNVKSGRYSKIKYEEFISGLTNGTSLH